MSFKWRTILFLVKYYIPTRVSVYTHTCTHIHTLISGFCMYDNMDVFNISITNSLESFQFSIDMYFFTFYFKSSINFKIEYYNNKKLWHFSWNNEINMRNNHNWHDAPQSKWFVLCLLSWLHNVQLWQGFLFVQ